MMELSSQIDHNKVRVINGECQPPVLSNDDSAEIVRPFGVFKKVLLAIADLCSSGGLEITDQLLGQRGKILGMFEPILSELPGQTHYPEAVELPSEESKIRLFQYMADTLTALTRGKPVLLIFDDLQWADELSFGLFHFLLQDQFFSKIPLLLMGTYRSEETIERLQILIKRPDVSTHRIHRLDEGNVRTVVYDMLAATIESDSLISYLNTYSEGNPLFVAEYLKTAVDKGLLTRDDLGTWKLSGSLEDAMVDEFGSRIPLPRTLREILEERIKQLSKSAQEVVSAAAVLGRDVESSLVFGLTGLNAITIMNSLLELFNHTILEQVGNDRLRFVHDKLREVAYMRISIEKRGDLHCSAAMSLESNIFTEEPGELAAIAFHWDMGGQPQNAKTFYLKAARAAQKKYALEEAETLYNKYFGKIAEHSSESIEALLELAETILIPQARNVEAQEITEKAHHLALQLSDSKLEAQSLYALGSIFYYTRKNSEALKMFDEAYCIAELLADRTLKVKLLISMANCFSDQGQIDQARTLLNQAAEVAEEQGDWDAKCQIINNQAVLDTEQNRADEAKISFESVLAIAKKNNFRVREMEALSNLAILTKERGELKKARNMYKKVISLARDIGDKRAECYAQMNLAILLESRGDTATAKNLYEQVLQSAILFEDRATESNVRINLAGLNLDRGDIETARKLYEESIELARSIHYRRVEGFAMVGLVICYLHQVQLDKAVQTLKDGYAIAQDLDDVVLKVQLLIHMGICYFQLGQLETSKTHYEKALKLVQTISIPHLEANIIIENVRLMRLLKGPSQKIMELLAKAESISADTDDVGTRLFILCEQGYRAIASGTSAQEYINKIRGELQRFPESESMTQSRWNKSLRELDGAESAFIRGDFHLLCEGELMANLPAKVRNILAGDQQ